MPGKRKLVSFIVDDNGCHICTSHHIGRSGYPCVEKDGRNQNLHRVLYEEAFGPLEPGLVARHKCDVRACINLEHIIPGTRADNSADMVERNRTNPPVGTRSGSSKLTIEEVQEIRSSSSAQSAIASKYKINQSTVSRIQTGKRWNDPSLS